MKSCDRIGAFLAYESRLLDQDQLDTWLELFSESGTYWIPSRRGQADAVSSISFVYDNRDHLTERVRRLVDAHTETRKPPTEMVHILSLPAVREDSGEIYVSVNFVVKLARQVKGERNLREIAGGISYKLQQDGNSFLIDEKRVDILGAGYVTITDLNFII